MQAPGAVAGLVRRAGAATARDRFIIARAFPKINLFRVGLARPGVPASPPPSSSASASLSTGLASGWSCCR
jgi:hypothetical protein